MSAALRSCTACRYALTPAEQERSLQPGISCRIHAPQPHIGNYVADGLPLRRVLEGCQVGRQEIFSTVSFAWYLPSSHPLPSASRGAQRFLKAQALLQAACCSLKSTPRAIGAMGAPSHMPRFREG